MWKIKQETSRSNSSSSDSFAAVSSLSPPRSVSSRYGRSFRISISSETCTRVSPSLAFTTIDGLFSVLILPCRKGWRQKRLFLYRFCEITGRFHTDGLIPYSREVVRKSSLPVRPLTDFFRQLDVDICGIMISRRYRSYPPLFSRVSSRS